MVVERIKSSREASRTDSLEPLMQEERCSFGTWKFLVCFLGENMAHLVQKIVRFDNDFSGVWTTTPPGFSAERVWDCQQYFAGPLLLMPTGRLALMCSGSISID